MFSSVLFSALFLSVARLGAAGMYSEQVIQLDSNNFDRLVMDSSDTFIVKFMAPWCGHCQQSAPAFSKAAKRLDGVAKIGVINCDDEKELASRFGIRGFPTIKIFKGEGHKARRPSDYNGERSASAIIEHAKYILPTFITRVKSSGIDAFFRDERRLPHVLLFTDKQSTSPLYKGMSAEFRNLASFGEVRKQDAGDLIEKFGVTSFPSLFSLKAEESDPSAAVAHSGAMDPKSLREFFKSVTEGVAASQAADSQKPKEPVFSQPKAYKAEVVPVLSGEDYATHCGSRKDGRMCGIAFLPGGAAHDLAEKLVAVADKFQFDNFAFVVVDTTGADGGGASLAAKFGIEKQEGFATVRPRKNKYAVHSSETDIDVASISSFLDSIVGGNARFKKLGADLPKWEGPAKPDPAQKDEEGEANAEKSKNESDASSGSDGGEEDGDQCGTEPPKEGEEAKCGA